jgi:hypothetical protein
MAMTTVDGVVRREEHRPRAGPETGDAIHTMIVQP